MRLYRSRMTGPDSGFVLFGRKIPGTPYWKDQKLPQQPLTYLLENQWSFIADAILWEEHLDTLGITVARHRRIATEGALLGTVRHNDRCRNLVIVSDDAGQFNILQHALCWIHTERLVHTLIPLNEKHRKDIAKVRDEIWDFYRDLKSYKIQPDSEEKIVLEARFDTIFTQRTSYELLNQLLKRIHKNKSELYWCWHVLKFLYTPMVARRIFGIM